MEEILHQLIGSLSCYLQGFSSSQVVQDFSHQQYHQQNFRIGSRLRLFPTSLVLQLTGQVSFMMNDPSEMVRQAGSRMVATSLED